VLEQLSLPAQRTETEYIPSKVENVVPKQVQEREIVSTELSLDQLEAVSGGDQTAALLNTTMTNLMSMAHEVLKTYVNNLGA
jgi:hypothetical protein